MKVGNPRSTAEGFSLVELLVTLGVFTLVVGSVSFFAADSFRASRNAQMRVRAIGYVQEITNAIIINKGDSWLTVANASDGVPKHVEFSEGTYSFADGEEEKNGVTLSITVEAVYRDGSGNIVESGGVEDSHSREVTVSATWVDLFGSVQNANSKFYVNDWNTARWIDTTEADFTAGTHDGTYVENAAGGEVVLETMQYGDWCNPNLALSSADLPGNGVAQSLWAIPGEVFAGTGQNASGLSYINVLIDNEEPPNVTIEGTLDGYKTNNVFGEDDYAYIATDTNDSEIAIIDLTAVPLAVIGYFDSPGQYDGDSVAVANDVGYMSSNSVLYSFDLTSRIGSRTELDSITLAGKGRNIMIRDDYAYVAVGSTGPQLQIVDISDPENMAIVGQMTVDAGLGVDLFVNEMTTRVFLATESSATQAEVFIIDVETKTGDRTLISSYETTDMNPKGIISVTEDQRMIVVGHGGEEYQVADISDEENPEYCGGIQVDNAIHDVVSVITEMGAAYSYIVTGDTSAEFKMIKGGLGGGGAGGVGHIENGTFESRVFDTNSIESYYYYLDWDETVPAGTNLRLQVRAGSAPDLSGVSWIGPDGTTGTYFTDPLGNSLPTSLNNKRYFQYRAVFDCDTVNTPELKEVRVNYQS